MAKKIYRGEPTGVCKECGQRVLEIGSKKIVRIFDELVLDEHCRETRQDARKQKRYAAKDFRDAIECFECDTPYEYFVDDPLSLRFLRHSYTIIAVHSEEFDSVAFPSLILHCKIALARLCASKRRIR